MIQVLPSIIPYSKQQLQDEMKLLADFASRVQVDICDGVFARPATWPYNGRDTDFFEKLKLEDTGWPEWEKVEVELHLMVAEPEKVLLDWIKTGISAVVVHIEATHDFQKIIDMAQEYTVAVGLALKPSTDISLVTPFVNQVDFIQVMGSDNIGHHGEQLQPQAVEKIKTLHEMFPERIISIDIGVNEDTAQELVDAGATKCIVGGVILDSPNPGEVFEYLQSYATN